MFHQKLSSVVQFFILGGEPFLNDEIITYVERVRNLYPKSFVSVVTNGLLIPKLPEQLLKYLGANNVCVSISEYKPTHLMIEQIVEILNNYNIIYNIRKFEERQRFNKPLAIERTTESYCISDGCINIGKGKVARCPSLMYIADLNEKFNLNFPTEGVIDLDSVLDGGELRKRLNERVPLCQYCIKNEIEWQPCGKKVQLEHFVKVD